MPEVLELAPQHLVWLHAQVRMHAFQGLHAGQLIRTDRAFSLLDSPWHLLRLSFSFSPILS